jgi:hypothetical protein
MDLATHTQITDLWHEAASNPNPQVRRDAFRQAGLLIAQSAPGYGQGRYTGGASRLPYPLPQNPQQVSQFHPPDHRDFVLPLMAPDRILTVANIPSVNPQAISPGERLEFASGGGWLIGWRGSVVDNTAGSAAAGEYERATYEVSAFFNDGEYIITNGETSSYVPFSHLFPPSGLWTPMMRRVDPLDVLNFNFRNTQPVTGHALQGSLSFAFWRERYPQ